MLPPTFLYFNLVPPLRSLAPSFLPCSHAHKPEKHTQTVSDAFSALLRVFSSRAALSVIETGSAQPFSSPCETPSHRLSSGSSSKAGSSVTFPPLLHFPCFTPITLSLCPRDLVLSKVRTEWEGRSSKSGLSRRKKKNALSVKNGPNGRNVARREEDWSKIEVQSCKSRAEVKELEKKRPRETLASSPCEGTPRTIILLNKLKRCKKARKLRGCRLLLVRDAQKQREAASTHQTPLNEKRTAEEQGYHREIIDVLIDLSYAYLRVKGIVCISSLLGCTRSCFQCFVEVQDSINLCWGYVILEHEVRNIDACFKRLNSIFNNNRQMLESARVGAGYDQQLNDIMDAEIQPILQDFHQTPNYDYVYEQRLQTAADNFVAAASQLPRVSGCFPPCGFQSAGAVYNCETCLYDSCEFPLDCPVEEIKVMENSRVRMQCNVPFDLPSDFQAVWRFAEKVKTQQVDEFTEVTAGVDKLFSIPSTTPQHQGTYQCEIYSDQRSIVRLYFHVSVTPQVEVGHTELQEIFDLSLLPGGSLLPAPDPPHSRPSAVLLGACLGAVVLLLLLSLGTVYRLSTSVEREDVDALVEPQNMIHT